MGANGGAAVGAWTGPQRRDGVDGSGQGVGGLLVLAQPLSGLIPIMPCPQSVDDYASYPQVILAPVCGFVGWAVPRFGLPNATPQQFSGEVRVGITEPEAT